MELLSSILSAWEAGPIIDNPATAKLKMRTIAGRNYQFRVMDIKARTRLGMKVMAQADKFKPLIVAGVKAREAQDENAKAAVAAEFVPQILSRLAEDDFVQLFESLVAEAMVDLGTGKFESLAQENVLENAFGDDITIQIPVALTVAEVNLEGFFNRIMAALDSA